MKPRRKTKLTEELAYQVHDLARRDWTERSMAHRFGVSTGTIRRAKAMPLTRPLPPLYATKKAAPAPVVPVQSPEDADRLVALLSDDDAPESEPDFIADLFAAQAAALDDEDVAAERQRLRGLLSDADTHDEANAIELEIAKLDPVVAHYLAAGDTRVLALSVAGHSPLILSRPEDLAELASLVTYGPELEQEDGESDEDFARCIGARRFRAIELLTQALTIIVTTAPETVQGAPEAEEPTQ